MERRLSDFFTPDVAQRAGCVKKNPGFFTDPLITGLEYDSRKIKPGDLYFALPGLHVDGHDYVSDAIGRGAAAIVHQNAIPSCREGIVYIRVKNSRFAMSPISAAFYDFPSRRLALIGVTGTEGKSTTVYLIYQILRLMGKKAGFISTVQYSDGEIEVWNPEHQTTPEAPAIHKLLADMRDRGTEFAVIESSSHGLSSKTNRLGDAAFDVVVMTNVTHEHLEFHGTWEQYRNDKANLFRALDKFDHAKPIRQPEGPPPAESGETAADVSTGLAGEAGEVLPSFGVANADDPSAAYFSAATKRKTYTYSTRGAEADLSLRLIESGSRGNWYEVLIRETGETTDIRDRLPGAFNAGNVLAALLVVSGLLSIPVKDLCPLVPLLKPVRGRMTVIQMGQPFEVLVDYAHTPSSFEAIFPPLRERLDKTGGRILSLFGSAGERDTQKRPEQGRIASQWSDMLFLTDEDPRGEEPLAILEEIAAGCPERNRGKDLFLIPSRPKAIRKAFSLARPGDLVLLLGKGHENSIIYAKKTCAYDEIGEAEKALTEMGWGQPV
ncbi:MAG: UDP-N-acetylmuramoyl-L-alanyl-D-glutamate--2,6-diaminopimelate ligase [Treponema sp.]|jgi:UDP-N-acetylmuramoyl-L-alanyl-D-glutamate--2,6-diaminopimelate ligase|nr:UDP-N-acetylmuramoyl-L-alanyl-D-glutamate--2,6-diaminopimelate ligase [Treponema sp.]